MQSEVLEFIAKVAWPFVGLIAILVLGPGCVLKGIIGALGENLYKITAAVNESKTTAADFHRAQTELKDSTKWVTELQAQLDKIADKIESINITTAQLVIQYDNRFLVQAVGAAGTSPTAATAAEGPRSAQVMFDDIPARWRELIAKLKTRVGNDAFDARSIGQMAWRLVDGRLSKHEQLTATDAELIERLHSQMKRFNRLQSNFEDWLTHEVYSAFIQGVDQASAAL
jgi:hypothetical protein